MKVGVVIFPGSNCDDDAIHCFRESCGWDVHTLWHKEQPDLDSFDFIAIPGGFTYGDYLRVGAMASISPIMEKIKEFAHQGGYVFGICNGFQILCEAGLLPGALASNESLKFVCKDVNLVTDNSDSPWTNQLTSGESICIPIAHQGGRYVISDSEYETLKTNGQIAFTYSDNPNGSAHDIAGVMNEKKNVMGMMPHPERATDLRSKDGVKLWKSLISAVNHGK